MAFSIKRLRWVLVTGALLLVAVLAAYIGYGRWRALRTYATLIKTVGPHISHDTNGITFSQSVGANTNFTLHARSATQLGAGKYDLHGVDITIYGRMANRTDRIFGDEFTYDEKEGLVTAIGEVHMDLQAPQSLTSAGHVTAANNPSAPQKPESAEVIHVRTSGLQYLRKLGVAATSQQVEFHFGGMECTAQGAEFDSSQSTLRLLSDVVATGLMHDRPVTVHATRADVDRIVNVATLESTHAESEGRSARADHTVLTLRTDGSIQSAHASGHIELDGKTQRVNSAALDATFTPQTVAQTARLSGGVQLADTDPSRPMQGSSSSVDILFDAQGAPASLTATGDAHFVMTDKRDSPRGLMREMQGGRIIAHLASTSHLASPSRSGRAKQVTHLTDLHAAGSAFARGESFTTLARPRPMQRPGPQIKTITLSADDLDLSFVQQPQAHGEPHAEPHQLIATGHTLIRQQLNQPANQNAPPDAPLVSQGSEQETSAGDALTAEFAPSSVKGRSQLTLVSALQIGHVVVRRTAPANPSSNGKPNQLQLQVATGTAERASYDGIAERLTLTGNAHLTQDDTTISAASIARDERTQDAEATGNVQATLEGSQAPGNAANVRAPQFTHVLSATAHFNHDGRQAEFHGSNAQPARIWQDASQVQAATLILDSLRHTFSARPAAAGGLIHAVFAGTPSSGSKPTAEGKQLTSKRAGYVRVAAARMDYSELQHQAIFTSVPQTAQGVVIEGDAGTIRAERAVAFMQPQSTTPTQTTQPSPTPVSGSLDHIVITGNVALDQAGRHGTGDQLVYTAATGESVLTGSPERLPHIEDARQGSITAPKLLFGNSGSTIVLSGESNSPKPVRVHTETHLEEKSASSGTKERQ